MRLSVLLPYTGSTREAAHRVPDFERAGADGVWMPEVWGFDSPTLLGYLAAITTRISLGTGILNVYSRTPATIAQTVAGLDHLSQGRAQLGIGTSGPQVIEGWHGVPFEQPLRRIRDVVETTRDVLARHLIDRSDQIRPGQGTGHAKGLRLLNRPYRSDVPIAVAALTPASVRLASQIADAWMPMFYVPELADDVWGSDRSAGAARRDPGRAGCATIAGGLLAIDTGIDAALSSATETAARYIGAMGARGANFYTDLASRYGYAHEAERVQDLYLAGDAAAAQGAVPTELVERCNLIGSATVVAERIAEYARAGVDEIMVTPVGSDPVDQIRKVRALLD